MEIEKNRREEKKSLIKFAFIFIGVVVVVLLFLVFFSSFLIKTYKFNDLLAIYININIFKDFLLLLLVFSPYNNNNNKSVES